jgi:hypothetical protein
MARTIPLFCLSRDNSNSLCGEHDPPYHVHEADDDRSRMCGKCLIAAGLDPFPPRSVSEAAQALVAYGNTLVVPPQLLIVVLSDLSADTTIVRTNALGGMAVVPGALRELATKLEAASAAGRGRSEPPSVPS